MPHFFGEAKKRVGCRAEHPATPHGSASAAPFPSGRLSNGALRCATVANVKSGFAARPCWRMKQYLCPAGRPSRVSARQPSHFSCVAKRSNQEKATPMMAVPAARGLHTPLAPKSGSVGNSLRSDSRRFFIRFRHQRRGVINGDPRQRQLQLQLQLSLRGTSKATVAARKSNRNCRCAEGSKAAATVAARK